MHNILVRIKRAVLRGNYVLTDKAEMELDADGLDEQDVAESILGADQIQKTIRSNRPRSGREYLHIICSPNFSGVLVYTKGKLIKRGGEDVYYVFISAKRST